MKTNQEQINTNDVDYDLKTPCSDCPFRKDVAYHAGVLKSLPHYHAQIEQGKFAHTCHKTDSRSDGFKDNYKGRPKHCAGALLLLKNDPDSPLQVVEIKAKKKIPKSLYSKKNRSLVFSNFIEMFKYYMKNSNHKDLQDLVE